MSEAGVFSAPEMIELAIQLEENGQAFYEAAAQRAQEGEVKQLLELLAREEVRHAEVFRLMKPEEKEHRPRPEYTGQKSDYVQALLEGRLLPAETVVNEVLPRLASEAEILDFALGFEKDTILFYYEMRHLLGEAERPLLKDVIEQEKLHVERLRRLCHRCRLRENQ
jgi:rubrerythrin